MWCISRALNYPRLPAGFQPAPGQVRASAHTDYGAITILRYDIYTYTHSHLKHKCIY
jgi:isopenicillin N synthase-like dioxygenase